jgi:septal ring factor EnvC (AmiA/AmiB activator)
MSEMAAEGLQETLAEANKIAAAYGPLGGSLGILELRPVFERMKGALESMHRTLAAVDTEIKSKREFSAALDAHIANQERRAAELAAQSPEEERRLQGRLSAIEGQIAQADEIRRIAEGASQRSVESVAAWLRQVRGG